MKKNLDIDVTRIVVTILDKLIFWLALRDVAPEQRADIIRALSGTHR